jgi:hypothetical protein
MDFAPIPLETGPDRVTPKVFGILNIIFALGLMVCNLCYSFYGLLPSFMNAATDLPRREAIEEREEARQQLEQLKADERRVKDEEQKAEIARKRKPLETRLAAPPPPAVEHSAWKEPRYFIHFAADFITGELLNVLMLIAGIGLLRLSRWGRTLAIWVAWLKIARLALLGLSMALLVAPVVTRGTTEWEVQDQPQAPGPKPAVTPQVAWQLGAAATAWGVGLFLAGSIYPVLMIVMLGRRRVHDAFDEPKHPIEPPGPLRE